MDTPGGSQGLEPQSHDDAGAVALVRFAQALDAASSLDVLARSFMTGFGRLMAVPMYGFNLVDTETGRLQYNVVQHVSDAFVARYARRVWDEDPLRVHAFNTRQVTYNLDLMCSDEWRESFAYREAFSLHAMRHVVEAPIVGAGQVLGGVHFASSDPTCGVTARDLQVTAAVGRMLGGAIERLQTTERLERERDRALTALEMTDTAVVFSDRVTLALRYTAAAERLLRRVANHEEAVYSLLVRPATPGGFSRRVAVELVEGGVGVLHGHSSPVPAHDGELVTVLELDHQDPGFDVQRLIALTPRERQVAVLVVEGLADREIAEQLYLSVHTVNQYVKQIYRRLEVGSRVELTRFLLAQRPRARRT